MNSDKISFDQIGDRNGGILSHVFLIIVLLVFIFIYLKFPKFINTHANFIQLVMVYLAIFSIVITVIYAIKQINETRKIEEDRKHIAILSLVKELEYNREMLNSYIQHTEVGGNVKVEGMYTLELNQPQSKAYEMYFTIACSDDLETSWKMMDLYCQLDGCKSLISYINQLVTNNFLTQFSIPEGKKILEDKIKGCNKQLYDLSKENLVLLDELINKLNSKK